MELIQRKSYIKGIFVSSFANVIAMIASLATVTISARLLAKEDLGSFFLVNVIVLLSATLGDFGLRNTAIKFLSEVEGSALSQLSAHFWTLNMLAALLTALFVLISLPVLNHVWTAPEFQAMAWFAAPASFLQMLFQMALSIFAGGRRFHEFAKATAIIELARMLLSVLGLILGFGVQSLFWGLLLSRAIIVGFLVMKDRICFKFSFDHPKRREILRFGGWLQGSYIVSVITMKTVDGIIGSYLGPAALAAYTTAMQIPSALQRIFESVRPVILGYISSLNLAASEQTVRSIRMLSGVLSIAALLLLMLAEPLVCLIFSEKYIDSVPILQGLSVWVSIGLVNYYQSITLTGFGRSKAVFLLTVPQFVVMVVVSSILVPKWGGIGAASALIITSLFGNLFGCLLLADGKRTYLIDLLKASFHSSILLLLMLILILNAKPSSLNAALLVLPTVGLFLLAGGVGFQDIRNIFRRIQLPEVD